MAGRVEAALERSRRAWFPGLVVVAAVVAAAAPTLETRFVGLPTWTPYGHEAASTFTVPGEKSR